jgi:acyl carrier protein
MNVTLEEISTLVSLQLGKRKVHAADRIVEDLGAESADVANIIATLDEKYQIEIDEADIPAVRTVTDLFELVRRYLEPS